ncbi:winged helix DNA-binding domain-containing protein [Jiangella gansuensis]|uniref:winged helix DNA-binding domain-containing protein n=1 Tax=Jiangella gansuensis TaxID=281473 RepID=UPI00146FA622|nr:winged helix DNA-binding domain-containing protein [Jiangella gansuensis]
MAVEKVSWGQALAWRLRRQYVAEASPGLLATASRLVGLHAQVASTAELIAAVRTPSYALGDTAAALWTDRTLVRTWGMRGTLHLFPAEELPLLVAAFAQRQFPKLTPAWERYHGITGADLRRVTDVIGEVLPGRVLTREELSAEVLRVVRKPAVEKAMRSGWGQIFKPAAAGGLLCSGPDRDRNVTFTDPRGWLPDAPWDSQPDEHTAMAAVIGRFLDTYGPATHTDFSRWWGIDPAAARRLFADHADVIVEVDLDGIASWLTPAGLDAMLQTDPQDAGGVWLLPGFDPYVIAPVGNRVHTVPEGYLDRVSRAAGWISPVLVVDGVVRGVWGHELKNSTLTVTVEPFEKVSAATKAAVTSAAARYGELFGADVQVSWATAD